MNQVVKLDETKLAQVTRLDAGGHTPNEGAMCAMEAVAFIAGEPWSDAPQCASPVIAAFIRAWNDGLPSDERNALLLPLIPRLVGTRVDDALETRLSLMAADHGSSGAVEGQGVARDSPLHHPTRHRPARRCAGADCPHACR